MKLRTRFVLGYLLMALVTGALGFFSLQIYGNMNQEVSLLQEDVIPGAISMMETDSAVGALVAEVEQFVRSGEADDREEAGEAIDLILENMTEHVAHEKSAGQQEGQEAQELSDRTSSLTSMAQEVMDAAGEQVTTRAEMERVLKQMSSEIEALTAVFQAHMPEHVGELAEAEGMINQALADGDPVDKELDMLLEHVMPGLISMLEMEASFEALRGEVSTMVISRDLAHREHVEEAIASVEEKAAEHTEHASHLGEEEGQEAQDIEDQAMSVISLAQQVVSAVEAEALTQARLESAQDQMHADSEILEVAFEEHVAEHLDEIALAEEHVSGGYSSGVRTVWAAIIVALALCLVVAFVTVRVVLKPINLLSDAAGRVSGGDLDVVVDVESLDETGMLANAFNHMVARLREMVRSEKREREYLQATVQSYVEYAVQVGGGDLSARLTLDGEGRDDDDPLIQLGQQLNWTSASLQRIIHQIGEAAGNLSSASAEILASTAQQLSSASEQSAAISQTTTTVDEVRNIAEQVVARAQEVADTAQRSVEFSRAGEGAVGETIESMAGIKQRVEGIAENILALSEQTQQIGNIIATVDDIASQSNMLALNASVEAARAGEQGKGFAVVAMEVRSLAEQSKQATTQIEEILSEIQKATNMTVMATEEGSKGVEEGVNLSAKTGDVIQQLGSVITQSAQAAVQMVAGGQQQTSGIEQIALAMANINQATVQSLASTRQAEKAARDLNDLAQSLIKIVEQYQ